MVGIPSTFAIAVVGTGLGRGQVGMASCPGRGAPWLLPGLSERELERDVATVARWGATALISLLDEFELARLHLRRLPDLLATARVHWHHVPLPPSKVPDAEFDRAWNSVATRIYQLLRQGGKIVIHCRDGRSRTGMITGRLLVELGCQPQDAINRVRAARPGALDNLAEEKYVLSRSPIPDLDEGLQLALLGEDGQGERSGAEPLRMTSLRIASGNPRT
jgi:ADP-ribosyl-[dinitrogen reductase] hydrolase